MRVAIIVSVMAHVAMIAWASTNDPAAPPAIALVRVPPAPPVRAAVRDEPIAVLVIADLPAVAATPSPVVPPAISTRRGSQRLATSTRRAVETPAVVREQPAHAELMVMRKPTVPNLAMSAELVDELVRRSKPPVIPDLPGARIDHEIEAIQDRMRAHAGEPGYDATADRIALVELREAREQVELKQQKDGTYRTEKRTFTAKVAQDGTVAITEHIGGMDAYMKKHGQDPYASNKRNFLDRTRDQRVAIGTEYRKQVWSHSREYMTANLLQLWASTAGVAARKQALFELWDDCAETGADEQVAGAVEARRILYRWIQMKLAGADRYTADELARFNAKKTSKATFAPYAAD